MKLLVLKEDNLILPCPKHNHKSKVTASFLTVVSSCISRDIDGQIYFVFGLDDESCDDDNEGEGSRAKNNLKPIRTRRQVSYRN